MSSTTPSSLKKTNLKYGKDFINSVDDKIKLNSGDLRKSRENKVINYNLYNNILDPEDMSKLENPFNLPGFTSPTTPQNHPISNVKIDLLYGEYLKRKFPYTIRVGNYDAISQKEEEMNNRYAEITAMGLSSNSNPDEFEKMVKQIQADNRTYQDRREIAMNRIVNHEVKKLKFEDKIADSVLDLLISAEMIHFIDVVGKDEYKEVVFEKLNPLNVYTFGMGESHFIHDAEIIVVEDYVNKRKLLDLYWEEPFSERELKSLEGESTDDGLDGSIAHNPLQFQIPTHYVNSGNTGSFDTSLFENPGYSDRYGTGLPVDIEGNIRRLRVFWASTREMQYVTSFDESGNEIHRIEDKQYKIDEFIGETSKKFRIKEWWEGHKIHDGIFKRVRPRPVQLREVNNPSKCYPPVIGGIMAVNSNKAMSLMDRMKPYQYLYNLIAERTINAISLSYGKIMRVSLLDIPDGWNVSKWLNYVHAHKIWFYDPFKEGNKGAATGKLSGSMQQRSDVVDMELGVYINYYIQIMEYIENQLGQIVGISPQREASISTSEKVGNVERALTQSSHITEKWFKLIDSIRLECVRVLMETCKIVYKDKRNFKAQSVLSTGESEIFSIDGMDLSEADYDIHVTSGSDETELLDLLKSNVQALIQNDKADIMDLVTLFTEPSIANITRKIQTANQQRSESAQKAQEDERNHELQVNQMTVDAELQKHMDTLKLEYAKLTADIDKNNAENNIDGIKTIEELKIKAEALMLGLKDIEIKKDTLKEVERSNREKEKIEKLKIIKSPNKK